MHYLPLTSQNRDEMLKEIGVSSFDDLIKGIPESLKNPKVLIPPALSEAELQACFIEMGKKNKDVTHMLSFLGGGSYEHFIPSAVSSVLSRHEFYTAYTPYQAEASQGSLQAIYEFQSLITELTELDVSNASHYDGSTSLAEAALLALRHTGRSRVLVARTVHPHYRQVLKTYLEGTPFEAEEIGYGDNGGFSREQLSNALGDDVAGVILQTPNFFGTVEDLEGVAEEIHSVGALMILSINPLSLGVFKSPGEWGADIAVGEGQPLGIPLHLGGPYVGLFATTKALMRKVPGRLAGLTKDPEGKRAFVLTLQAREQHIRRERAASNICTNQALCALAACVYMTLLGKTGIQQVGEINLDRSHYLREQINQLDGFDVDMDQPIFNEFRVKSQKNLGPLMELLKEKRIFAGIQLESFYPELKNELLVCATETKTQENLDSFVEALRSC